MLLCGRVIAGAVHGKGEHPRLVLENGRRAVALMHVKVHDEDFAHGGLVGQQPMAAAAWSLSRQNPSPRARNAWCVPPGNVEGHAVLQGQPCRLQRAAQNGDFARKQRCRPREARGALLLARELPQAQPAVVIGGRAPAAYRRRAAAGGQKNWRWWPCPHAGAARAAART